MDARTRLRGCGGAYHGGGGRQRQAPGRQSPRAGHRAALPDRFPRAENHAGSGHLADSRFRGKHSHRQDLRKLVVREVMSKPLPQVPRTAPVERVTHILSHENPAVFVEMGNGHFEILTKYDLMSTVASLMETKR